MPTGAGRRRFLTAILPLIALTGCESDREALTVAINAGVEGGVFEDRWVASGCE
jgi:hypothetical protein